MPFDWMRTARTAGLPESIRLTRRAEMYRMELIQRAGLLCRLGYSQDRARARLRANVAWDFELGGGPGRPDDRLIDTVVEGVYRAGSSSE